MSDGGISKIKLGLAECHRGKDESIHENSCPQHDWTRMAMGLKRLKATQTQSSWSVCFIFTLVHA
jgi:hypothetical protein